MIKFPFELSTDFAHTWFFDLDGTIMKHKGNDVVWGEDDEELLPGVKELWETIPKDDIIILVSARSGKYKNSALKLLEKENIRYNHVIFDLPRGERILVNDTKPLGLKTAIAWNLNRNQGFE
jgi:hypothetical protein